MDIAIVIIYLIAVVGIGLHRGYRTRNIKDFAVGNKNFSAAILLATITATCTGGGSTFGLSERIFRSGILFVLLGILCNVTYKLAIAYIICPRFERLQKHLTMGEIMGGFYGKHAQVVTGFFGSVMCIGTIASQISAMGFIFHYFLGTSFIWAVFISAGIVILYTTFGGIRAVAATDVIQFFVLILGIVVVANCALVHVGGYEQLWNKLPASHKILFSDRELITQHVLLLILFAAPFLDPAEVQRLLLSNDNNKTKRTMVIATMIDPIIFFLVGCIGLCAIVLFPDIDGNLSLLTIVRHSVPSAALRGFAIAGLLAVVMSTADSYLNTATLAFVNDVILPIKKGECSKTLEMWLLRGITIVFGIMSIFIAIYFQNIFDIVLAFTSFWGSFMFIPFFAGLFGLRSQAQSFWASTILGFLTFFIWTHYYEAPTNVQAVFPAIFMSFLGFLFFFLHNKKSLAKVGI